MFLYRSNSFKTTVICSENRWYHRGISWHLRLFYHALIHTIVRHLGLWNVFISLSCLHLMIICHFVLYLQIIHYFIFYLLYNLFIFDKSELFENFKVLLVQFYLLIFISHYLILLLLLVSFKKVLPWSLIFKFQDLKYMILTSIFSI